jgi:serine/threonine protein phosphatase PrpC
VLAKATRSGARREQRDRVVTFSDPLREEYFILVSDGGAAHEAGATPAQAVVEVATALWTRHAGRPAPRDFLATLCETAHDEINRRSGGSANVPCATIAAVYVCRGEAHWVHSGHSRVYRFQGAAMIGRTHDHSASRSMAERGVLREPETGSPRDDRMLLQGLGGKEYKPPVFGSAPRSPGGGFLVCSDGFWEYVTPQESGALLVRGAELPQLLSNAVDMATRRGGVKADNASAAALSIRGQAGLLDVLRPYSDILIFAAALVGTGIFIAFLWL